MSRSGSRWIGRRVIHSGVLESRKIRRAVISQMHGDGFGVLKESDLLIATHSRMRWNSIKRLLYMQGEAHHQTIATTA